jgi:hypothetical protein
VSPSEQFQPSCGPSGVEVGTSATDVIRGRQTGSSDCTSPWFAGLTCDHLFADCPNRMKAETTLRRAGWWSTGSNRIDPHGTDVCGMCLYRHGRLMHKGMR